MSGSASPLGRWRAAWPWIAGAVAIGGVWMLLSADGAQTRSSSLSRGHDGLWLARAYLEARGTRVHLLDGPLGEVASITEGAIAEAAGTTLVLAFPWQRFPEAGEVDAVQAHLRRGGNLLLLYDGRGENPAGEGLWQAVGLGQEHGLRDRPPLEPFRWWQHRTIGWTLGAAEGEADPPEGLPPLRLPPGLEIAVPALDHVPRPDDDRPSEPLLELPRTGDLGPSVEPSARGAVVAFRYRHQSGQVVVLPVRAWHNAFLQRGDNAELLEMLGARLGDTWIFDEYHHGWIRPELIPESTARHAWDLLAMHLALLYALVLLALVRRFGPPWSEAPQRFGSTAAFLRSLGQLHHRLGHHADAARLIAERVRQLDPRFVPPPEAPDPLSVGTAEELVHLARAYATHPPTSALGPEDPRSEDPRASRSSRP